MSVNSKYFSYANANCQLQKNFNTFYQKEQVFDIYSIMPNRNLTTISFFNGNIVFDLIKGIFLNSISKKILDCDCFNKNLTQVINVGNNATSFTLYQGSVSRYCEANSLCEHFRVSNFKNSNQVFTDIVSRIWSKSVNDEFNFRRMHARRPIDVYLGLW